jgi:hypothetical protein
MERNKLDIKIKRDLLKLIKNQIDILLLNRLNVSKIKKHKDFKIQAKFIDAFVNNNINDIAILKNKFKIKNLFIQNILTYFFSCGALSMFILSSIYWFRSNTKTSTSFGYEFFSLTPILTWIFLIGLCVHLHFKIKIYKKLEPIYEYLIFLHKVKNRVELLSDKEII